MDPKIDLNKMKLSCSDEGTIDKVETYLQLN